MDADNDRLIREAADCPDCLGWLEHCGAQCCSVFTFWVTPLSDVEYGDDEITVHAKTTADTRRYYGLHGARVDGDYITVPATACERLPDRMIVHMRCSALREDLLCALHDSGQPRCCADFTIETAGDRDWVVTPDCLFAVKRHEPSSDGSQGG